MFIMLLFTINVIIISSIKLWVNMCKMNCHVCWDTVNHGKSERVSHICFSVIFSFDNLNFLTWCCRCSRFQSEIKRLKISSPVRVCQNCYYNLQHERSAEDSGRTWASTEDLRSISFLHLPCCSRNTSHTSFQAPSQSSRTSSNHMYCNTLTGCNRRDCWLFHHHGGKPQQSKWDEMRTTDCEEM